MVMVMMMISNICNALLPSAEVYIKWSNLQTLILCKISVNDAIFNRIYYYRRKSHQYIFPFGCVHTIELCFLLSKDWQRLLCWCPNDDSTYN